MRPWGPAAAGADLLVVGARGRHNRPAAVDELDIQPLEAEAAALHQRAFDLALSLTALALLAPLMAAVAVLIKLDSPGPVFFRQRRYGFNQQAFGVFKFRSMKVQPDAPFRQASRDDDRITRVGRFLRRTSIDELPQLFNVLKGEMSLVGPRPHAVAHDTDPAAEDSGHAPDPHAPGAHEVPEGTGGYHPHESPWPMLVPILLLSLGAVFAGFVFHGFFIEPESGERFWKGSIFFNEHLMHAMHGVPVLVKLAATIVMLIGLAIAWLAYIRKPDIPARFTATFGGLYAFLLNKWYFDELYNLIFVRPAFAFGRLFWKRGDEGTIDRFGPNGSAALVKLGSVAAGKLQTGYVYSYAFVMLIGLTAALTWAIAG